MGRAVVEMVSVVDAGLFPGNVTGFVEKLDPDAVGRPETESEILLPYTGFGVNWIW